MTTYQEITLDLCCGEGGGARGLVRAGHYVIGVDIDPGCRKGYLRSGAHEFICADAMEVLTARWFLDRFSFVTAHPPCQGYSKMMNCQPPEVRARYPRLIAPMQPLLDAWGGPFVIENVVPSPGLGELRDPVCLCMHMFDRPGYRHRLLEAGGGLRLEPPPAPERSFTKDRTRVNRECGWPHPVPTARAGHWIPGRFVSVAGHERKKPVFSVMEIDWMSDREAVAEAIPPYLGTWIAGQLAAWREAEAAA
jgi:hypothetical protein